MTILNYDDNVIMENYQPLDCISMDEELRDRFNSIEVLAKLMDGFIPRGRMYTVSSLPVNREAIKFHYTIDLWGGYKIVPKTSPTYLWNLKCGEQLVYLFLECGLDHEMGFPVGCCILTPNYGKTQIFDQAFHNKEDLIHFLDTVVEMS